MAGSMASWTRSTTTLADSIHPPQTAKQVVKAQRHAGNRASRRRSDASRRPCPDRDGQADGRWDLAYAPASSAEAPPDLAAALDANPKAAAFFATLTGANRYAILYRIGAVKTPEARARKIAQFVAMLERGETIHG